MTEQEADDLMDGDALEVVNEWPGKNPLPAHLQDYAGFKADLQAFGRAYTRDGKYISIEQVEGLPE